MILTEPTGFTGYNCEWLYNDVANEYRSLHGISEDTPYDEDELADKIWYYSYVHISYFVVWLARHHYLLNNFTYQKDENFDAYVTDMQNETGDALSFMHQTDGRLTPDYIRPSVRDFLNAYLDGKDSTISRYSDDHEYVIAKYSAYYYCNDFSWEVYHDLEKLIDEAFRTYSIGKEADEISYTNNTFFCKWLGLEIHVAKTDEVSDEYMNLCIAHFINMSGSMKKEILRMISELWSESDEKLSLESCNFDAINVFKPYGDEAAYTIGGEPDFEQEHGIAVTIRGEHVLAISFRDEEYTSPWSDEFSAEQK